MHTIDDIRQWLDDFAPPQLAEDWDNVGLLAGDRLAKAANVMTCLTITPASAVEALDAEADLIVAHHPLPFRGLKRITCDTTAGGLLWKLIRGGVAIYSPHTAFDSAAAGINQQLAEALGLEKIAPLRPLEEPQASLGAGRYGELPAAATLDEIAAKLKAELKTDSLQAVGLGETKVRKVGVACGAAGEFLDAARRVGCDLFVTGETNFHTCLEAEATGVGLLLTGHYASERFAVETLADKLQNAFPDCRIWASEREADPLRQV